MLAILCFGGGGGDLRMSGAPSGERQEEILEGGERRRRISEKYIRELKYTWQARM